MSLLRCMGRRFFLSQQSMRAISTARVCCDKADNAAGKIVDDPLKTLQGSKKHEVDGLEKRILVWSGKYKSVDDVPPVVLLEVMTKARNKIRIKLANYMMIAVLVSCAAIVYSGKQAEKRGESLQKMNLDWHKEMNDNANK